jgi:hypothetical protein
MVLIQEDDELHEHIIYYLSQNLIGPELKYSHVEKLALAVVHAVQRLCHYILLHKTTMVIDVNPFQYVLTRHIIGGKYNKWIVILQEFDLDFVSAKSKKSLVFAELMSDFPRQDEDTIFDDSFVDENIFLISSSGPLVWRHSDISSNSEASPTSFEGRPTTCMPSSQKLPHYR